MTKGKSILFAVLATAAIGISGLGAIGIVDKKSEAYIEASAFKSNDGNQIKSLQYGSYSSSLVYEDNKGIDHVYSSGFNTLGSLGTGDYLSTNKYVETQIRTSADSVGVDGDILSLKKERYGTALTAKFNSSYGAEAQ